MKDKGRVNSSWYVPKNACGKITEFLIYDNGDFYPVVYYCKRWNCSICAERKRKEITDRILHISGQWYFVFINDSFYNAFRQRIKRGGCIFFALGNQNNWLFLVDFPILSDMEKISGIQLTTLINQQLQGIYIYKQHRIRSTKGLFHHKKYINSKKLIQRIIVNETIFNIYPILQKYLENPLINSLETFINNHFDVVWMQNE